MRGMLLTTILLVLAACSEAPNRYDGPIIDMHQHARDKIFADRQFCFPRPCEGAPTQTKDAGELRGRALAAMDENKIVLAVISGSPPVLMPWVEGEEGRYLKGIEFETPDDVPIEQIRQFFETGQAQVLGEMEAQYANVPIDDPALDPYFALAHELDLPVHVHVAGLGGTTDFPTHLGNPQRIVPVLRKYPGLRIYFENAGWPFLEEMTSLMYEYPSVYADVSTILHLTPREQALDYVNALVHRGLGKRIMYGSDQMIWPEVFDVTIEALQSDEFLTPEQKADIFYNNAARFLRLSEEEIARHHAS